MGAIRYPFYIMLTVKDNWERLFDRDTVSALEALLPSAISSARWYGGKAKAVATVRIKDSIPLRTETDSMFVVFIEVLYGDGGRDVYTVVLTASFGERAVQMQHTYPQAVVAEMLIVGRNGDEHGLLHDALWDHGCAGALLHTIHQGNEFHGETGTLLASSSPALSTTMLEAATAASSVMQGEQSNTSVKFDRLAMLKLYRRFDPGLNPDLEIGRVLTAAGYPHSPRVLGALEYVGRDEQPATVMIVHAFIENQGDAWQYTLSELEGALANHSDPDTHATGRYAEAAALLGRRIAELHLALAQNSGDPMFAPEPCTVDYWQSLCDRMTRTVEDSLTLLGHRLQDLHEPTRELANLVFGSKALLLSRVKAPGKRNLHVMRVRCHGDFHLGQVLHTGRDFVIIDFEGEPARPLAERRAKQVPLLDVAGMIRSFHYAASTAMDRAGTRPTAGVGRSDLEQRARQWYRSAADTFLLSYAETAGPAPFLPKRSEDRDMLLDAFLIEKACYELSYELNNRPSWARIPMKGLLQLTQAEL